MIAVPQRDCAIGCEMQWAKSIADGVGLLRPQAGNGGPTDKITDYGKHTRADKLSRERFATVPRTVVGRKPFEKPVGNRP
jgi:hypothetical protein